MLKLGTVETLKIVREKEFGVYLADPAEEKGRDEETVLLPSKQVPAGKKAGDKVRVFLYKDSEDRMIATTEKPYITLGETALLRVKEISRIGAFLDMGLERDLLLPFKEQTRELKQGEKVLVALYVDKSDRLAATMKVYHYLRSDSPYVEGDEVEGTVFEIDPGRGAYVAVDEKYHGLVPAKELFVGFKEGGRFHGRVTKVRDDGKLDLSAREKAHVQIDSDADAVMRVIDGYGGVLPFTDKASPEVIAKEFNLSKNAFKRAVGRLLKEGKIEIGEDSIIKTGHDL